MPYATLPIFLSGLEFSQGSPDALYEFSQVLNFKKMLVRVSKRLDRLRYSTELVIASE